MCVCERSDELWIIIMVRIDFVILNFRFVVATMSESEKIKNNMNKFKQLLSFLCMNDLW